MTYPNSFQITTPTDREIVITRDFQAPRQTVFDAFTKPELVRHWLLGPSGWTMPVCEIDLRVGGRYRYVWRKEGVKDMGIGGEFREVETPRRLVATERFDDAWYAGEALNTTTFVEAGGITKATIIVRYESQEARDTARRSGMEHGMRAGYDRLEELLLSRPAIITVPEITLFTTGIRRGELLGLTLGDYNRQESTLHIRETKFYKSRLLPINRGIADEIDRFLRARSQRKLPVTSDSALIWNASRRGGRAYSGTSLRHCLRPLLRKCAIVTSKGRLPRIHDFRHSFAVNALLRWYRSGADVEAKLPLLATYLGHGSAVSTHYYLHFIEPLRTAASERFANHFGELVSPLPARRRG